MKNFAVVRFSSTTFSSETVHGKIIYRGLDEFTRQIGERLRTAFLGSGLECSDVERTFKPVGSGFQAGDTTSRYDIFVSAEVTALPEAEVVVSAEPRKGGVRNWSKFEPLFIRAVEGAFPHCHAEWMTEDEFVESSPFA